jgi:hypothetical protein
MTKIQTTITALLASISFSCFAERPSWVDSPESSGYSFAIVGSAMPQRMGKRAQSRMADLSAKQQFAAYKDTYISSQQIVSENELGKKELSDKTYQNAGGLLHFSQLEFKDEWLDPNSNELFKLYAVE